MKDLLIRIATDAAVLVALSAVLVFIMKKFFNSAVDTLFKKQEELQKATLEVAKEQEKAFVANQNAVYPEIVELVYRLRNQFRHEMDTFNRQHDQKQPWGISFGEELFMLTERLYKYRVFLDPEIFDMLHHYKRLLQDARVIGDRLGRPSHAMRTEEGEAILGRLEEDSWEKYEARYQESIGTLERLHQEVNELYPRITDAVQGHMQTVLSRRA